jgi:hypothetical protein
VFSTIPFDDKNDNREFGGIVLSRLTHIQALIETSNSHTKNVMTSYDLEKKKEQSGHGRTIYIFWIEQDFKHSFHGVSVISLRFPGQVSMSGQSSIKTYLPGVTTLPALLKNHYYYQDDVHKKPLQRSPHAPTSINVKVLCVHGNRTQAQCYSVLKCSLVHHCIGYIFLEYRYSIYIPVGSVHHPGVVQVKEEEMWCQIGKNYEYWTFPSL